MTTRMKSQNLCLCMRVSLEASAEAAGNKDWGKGGSHDAGHYNQFPEDTDFFRIDGTWNRKYGELFLEWYSRMLIERGDEIQLATRGVFQGTGATLSAKIAGIHWYYTTRSHAAELTAGYYNTRNHDGYLQVTMELY